jgi:hypothetical protein
MAAATRVLLAICVGACVSAALAIAIVFAPISSDGISMAGWYLWWPMLGIALATGAVGIAALGLRRLLHTPDLPPSVRWTRFQWGSFTLAVLIGSTGSWGYLSELHSTCIGECSGVGIAIAASGLVCAILCLIPMACTATFASTRVRDAARILIGVASVILLVGLY